MLKRICAASGLIAALGLAVANLAASRSRSWPDALTAHEWGTFTTVAGEDGRAEHWLPLGGPTDLPCFVEHFQNSRLVKLVPGQETPLDYASARSALWGKVRMETPVIYFYSRPERDVTVRVRFPRGWMTEWYPHALVSQPYVTSRTGRDAAHTSVIEWKNVKVAASVGTSFPSGDGESHYYAARRTEATPLRAGQQVEKFLFYRGVGDFDVPLTAVARTDGGVRVANLGSAPFPAVILFERRGDKLGYRIQRDVAGEVSLDAPALTGNLDTLRADLQRTLVKAGLFDREAAAMVDTWRDSWFEEGTRMFYIVPRRTVDAVLPLEITPAPDNLARVFVGRMEVITPATMSAVDRAIRGNDATVLARYARLLGPVTERLLAKGTTAASAERIHQLTNAALASYARRSMICE
ncbi:MAG TPA: hypothetical protein VH559_16985 [Gemmatimonadaceae bacterium]